MLRDFPTLSAGDAHAYLLPPFTHTPDSLASFRALVLDFYESHGRKFSWRETQDPYAILVSEVMLQQTQTSRVAPKYEEFLNTWGTLEELSEATVLDLLSLWKGLGYNRRALYLRQSAQLSEQWGYRLPADEAELLTLPGVGKATAAALMAFAFNKRSIYIETNVRRVILHCFFPNESNVTDKAVTEVLNALADEITDFRSWYYALLDYGVLLKALLVNPNRRSAHYSKQAAFENSNRQIRGLLIHHLTEGGPQPVEQINTTLSEFCDQRIHYCLSALAEEGFVEEEDGVYRITRS